MDTDVTSLRRLNLRRWIDDHYGGVQAKFVAETNINQGELSGLLNKKSFGEKKARNIEALAKMPNRWLDSQHFPITKKESNVSGLVQMDVWSSDNPLPEDEYVYVPFYKDISLAAGVGSFSEIDYNGYKLAFSRATLRRNNVQKDQVVCLSVRGNSMEPVLPDGSTASVNMGCTQIIDGKLYAINQGGLLRVKRLYVLPNQKVRINSYNQDEHPDEVEYLKDIEIIGRVFNWSVMDI